MIYNIDFLIAAIVILLLILWYFLGQKRAEDLNNQVFLFFAVLGVLDVIAEFFSTYCITSPESGFGIAAVFYNNGILSVAGIASFYVPLLYPVHA